MSASQDGRDPTGELELEVVERTGPNERLSAKRAGVLEQSDSLILDGLDDDDPPEADLSSITAAIDPLDLPSLDDPEEEPTFAAPAFGGPPSHSGLLPAAFDDDSLEEPTALAEPYPSLLPPPGTEPGALLADDGEEEAPTAAVAPLILPEMAPAPQLVSRTSEEIPLPEPAPPGPPQPEPPQPAVVQPAPSLPALQLPDLQLPSISEGDSGEHLLVPIPSTTTPQPAVPVPAEAPIPQVVLKPTVEAPQQPLLQPPALAPLPDEDEEAPTLARPELNPPEEGPQLPAAFAEDPSLFGDGSGGPIIAPTATPMVKPRVPAALTSSTQGVSPPPLPLGGGQPQPKVSQIAATEAAMPALRRSALAAGPAPATPAPAALPAPASSAPASAAPAQETVDEAMPRVVYAEEALSDSMDGEVTSVFESQPAPALPRGRLTIVGGEESGKIYYLNRPMIRLGRGNDNDIVLLDIAVSRNHARIERHDEGFCLIDLDSGNGTYVNGGRVQRSELYDGDRVELGNSLMEFATQGEARRRPLSPIPKVAAAARETDPGRTPPPAVKVSRKTPPPVWLVFLATFVVITGLTLLVQRSLLSNREAPEDPARVKARSYYDRAEASMRSREWDQALADLATAAELAPEIYREGDQQGAYAALVSEIEKEQRHHALYQEATALASKANPEALEVLLSELPEGCAYYPDAMRLIAQAKQAVLDTRTKEAERLAQAGFVAQALVITEEVLAKSPGHQGAKRLGDMLKAAVREGTPPAELAKSMGRATPADQRARRDLAEALRLYRDMQFSGAQAALKRGEARRPSKMLRARLAERAEKITAFSTAWEAAETAMKGRRAEEAITALSKASAIDQDLGGFFSPRVNEKLALLHYIEAKSAYDQGQLQEARRHNDRVLALSAADANGRKLRALLDRKAEELLHQAQNVSLQQPQEAQRLVRQVLNIAPQGGETYQKAYRLLQQLR